MTLVEGALPSALGTASRAAEFPAFSIEELAWIDSADADPEASGVAELISAVWWADPDDPDERDYLHAVVERFDRAADDGDGLDRIGELERSIRALQAEQLGLVAGYSDATLRNDADDPRVSPYVVGAARALEVGSATGTSTQAAQYKISLAVSAVNDHPLTLDFLRNGAISLGTLREVVAATKGLSDDDRSDVDRRVARDIASGVVTPAKLGQAARRHALAVDTDAARRRAEAARTDRSVTMKAGPDATAEVVIGAAAEKAVECMKALDHAARSVKVAGDARTLSQIRSDLAVERITGRTVTESPNVELQIVVSARTLFGLDDDPAMLRGFGALPSRLALALATSVDGWMRRLVAHPSTGHLVSADPHRRSYGRTLRDFLAWTWQGCAAGNCDSESRHIDHLVDYARGGRTTLVNGQPLCERHNYDKLHPDIAVTREPDGTIDWTLPSGRSYRTHPPPALGPGSGDPPF